MGASRRRCAARREHPSPRWLQQGMPRARPSCRCDIAVARTLRALTFAPEPVAELCVHERHKDRRWLLSYLTVLFAAGDILRNRRR